MLCVEERQKLHFSKAALDITNIQTNGFLGSFPTCPSRGRNTYILTLIQVKLSLVYLIIYLRTSFAAVNYKGEFWAIGGYGTNDTNIIHIFNGDSWNTGPVLPEGYRDVTGLGALIVDDKLYILG